ncbi:MAG: hypothetical protein HC859_17200 [Bacteroidia bacterium]|nr:hypothetical protein [Bacteroidia bacterium]
MPTKTEKELYQGKATTGHEWDGIQELDTPLPKWWVYVLYACIAWSVVYFVLYPSWPGITIVIFVFQLPATRLSSP